MIFMLLDALSIWYQTINFTALKFGNMKFLLRILLCNFFLNGFLVNAQLPVPNLDVVVTDETCSGAGQLTFNLTNTAPGASVLYSIFLLPEVTVPLYTISNNVISLPAGAYNVVAVQTLGSDSNFVTRENIIVQDLIAEPVFTVTQENNPCGGGSQIVVTVEEGVATQYEISSGPVRVPPQDSNVFPGLPEGDYIVRVFDACGRGITRSFTLAPPNNSPPVISNPVFQESISTGCFSVSITNTLSYNQGTIIIYPLTVVYTLHPGDGSPDIVIPVPPILSGDTDLVEITHVFDLVPGRTDTYDIQVTNGCGMAFPLQTGMSVTPVPRLSITKTLIPCGDYFLTVTAQNFVPPYQLDFLTPTVDVFDPDRFNSNPDPYNPVTVYGGVGNPVPEGFYTVQLTDACGRTDIATIEVIYEKPVPDIQAGNNGCYSAFGFITARIPERRIVFAEIVSGPPDFTEVTPFDVSSFIDTNGLLRLTDLPTGEYKISLTDDCGDTYTDQTIVVPEFVEKDFEGITRPDCAIGLGSVTVSSLNGNIVFMEVTVAPAEFNGGVTPLDVSEYIGAGGDLFMDALPAGRYRFEGTDVCGIERFVDVDVIIARAPVDTAVVPVPGCNSFNLDLNDNTAVDSATYWLQQENPGVPGEWRSPATGIVYTEGTVPNRTNSIRLVNGEININFNYFGTFRVVKAYETIGNGTATKNCVSVLGEPFTYFDVFEINDIYLLACNPGSAGDVFIDATGLGPLTYSITHRDGQPFVVNNGSNPVFSGLAPATYIFQVENACTELLVDTRDITTIPDLVVANPADDMQLCVDSADSEFQEFNLEERTAQILGNQSPEVYIVTYHLTRADAISGNNPIVSPYTNIRNPQTIYFRVVHRFINICPQTDSFLIRTTKKPLLTTPTPQYLCIGQGNLFLSVNEGYDEYTWTSDHPITQISDTFVEIFEPGIYNVTVGNIEGAFPACTTTLAIEVFTSEIPQNITFDIVDWTQHDNVIKVNVGTVGAYEYSIDGANYQDSPEFTGLDAGIYTVYINDTAGCGVVTREVVLLNYPKFFTPNGDGTHETWFIEYSRLEPEMIVYIYDRFGKLVTSFDAQSSGWDGTFNGNPLPATDYWFVVNRRDGRVLKGHFSLIR